jgi:hypothetical protein
MVPMTKQVTSADGQVLREMFAAATSWLEKSTADIDALNVFPVPDGDTGTNMLLTMRSCIEESYRAPDHSASAVAQAMAKGALIGARGNSGVILSQIWRGLAHGLADMEEFGGSDFAESLTEAASLAYKGLSNPIEGTILTVVKEAAAAAQAQVEGGKDDLISVVEAATGAAKESVANTPKLLRVLREAGVVDAGGQGLYTLLEGVLQYLKGEVEQMQFRKPWIIASSVPRSTRTLQVVGVEEIPYGYCTNFLLKGEGLDPEEIKAKLEKKGQSLMVVGDDSTIRVHIHTMDPGKILHYAAPLGTMHEISIRNMDEQHSDFLEMQKEVMPAVDIGIVAVVSGDGLHDVFTSLGTTATVAGGQTMNPSTKDLLQAVESVVSNKVIILSNNKNIILTAEQVQSFTEKKVEVVPTETIPQGVAALLAFDFEADFETNVELMKKAKSMVKSIEITRAVRSTRLGGLNIRKKQLIGFLDGDLVAVGDDALDVLNQVFARIDVASAEVVTIYYGADTEHDEAEKIGASIREQNPQLQIEVVRGGQPHYNYILSVE